MKENLCKTPEETHRGWSWPSPGILSTCSRQLIIGCVLAALLPVAGARADSDERRVIALPIDFPWNKSVKVRIGPQGGGRGSGALVSKCCVLTNGHVVWNGQTNNWRTIQSVHPGSYFDEVLGQSVDPFGNATPSDLRTNSLWVSTLGQEIRLWCHHPCRFVRRHGTNHVCPACV